MLEDKEDASDLREEMRGDRAVQISKREINALLTELLGKCHLLKYKKKSI